MSILHHNMVQFNIIISEKLKSGIELPCYNYPEATTPSSTKIHNLTTALGDSYLVDNPQRQQQKQQHRCSVNHGTYDAHDERDHEEVKMAESLGDEEEAKMEETAALLPFLPPTITATPASKEAIETPPPPSLPDLTTAPEAKEEKKHEEYNTSAAALAGNSTAIILEQLVDQPARLLSSWNQSIQCSWNRKHHFAAIAESRRREVETYTAPIVPREEERQDIQEFLRDFYRTIYNRRDEIDYLLQIHANSLGVHYQKLVKTDKSVSYEDFWQRYFYKCDPNRIAKYNWKSQEQIQQEQQEQELQQQRQQQEQQLLLLEQLRLEEEEEQQHLEQLMQQSQQQLLLRQEHHEQSQQERLQSPSYYYRMVLCCVLFGIYFFYSYVIIYAVFGNYSFLLAFLYIYIVLHFISTNI